MEHILLLSEMLQSAESGQGLKPVGMDGTGGGSPDFKGGDGNTMPSLLGLIYDRSDALCAVARGCMRMSPSQ